MTNKEWDRRRKLAQLFWLRTRVIGRGCEGVEDARKAGYRGGSEAIILQLGKEIKELKNAS
jgi:hypothetical protein